MSLEYAPLLTLDIIVDSADMTSTNCILRENKDTLIGRGTLDAMVAQRDELLSSRGFRVPARWDHSWNYKFGPTWTPEAMTENGGHPVYWYRPEEMIEETDNEGSCVEWTSQKETNNLEQNTVTMMPDIVQSGPRNFQYLDFDGTRKTLQMESNAMGGGTNSRFLIVFYVKLDPNTDANETMLLKGSNYTVNNGWSLRYDWSGSNRDLQWKVGNQTITATNVQALTTDSQIIVCGQKNNDRGTPLPFCYVYDGINAAASTTWGSSSGSVTNSNKPQIGRASFLGSDYFEGIVYELIMVEEDDTVVSAPEWDEMETLLTGYIAHKYGRTELLPDDHTYKSAIPRANIT